MTISGFLIVVFAYAWFRAITCNKNKVIERKAMSVLVNGCKRFKIKTAGQSLNGQR
jgi:hypothetical protein